jgi:outer membrane receptor protein involved in Fe transport
VAYDNSAAFQTAVCGSTCAGTSGLIQSSAISQYLSSMTISNFGHLSGGGIGYSSFIMPNITALENATNYYSYLDNAPEALGAVTGGATGRIDEATWGGYAEVDGKKQVFGKDLSFNVGLRYYNTRQIVAGPVQIGTAINYVTFDKVYGGVLPSMNLVYSATKHLKVRFAASQTITRADASCCCRA